MNKIIILSLISFNVVAEPLSDEAFCKRLKTVIGNYRTSLVRRMRPSGYPLKYNYWRTTAILNKMKIYNQVCEVKNAVR